VPHNYDFVFVIISVSHIHRLALINRLGDIILARNNRNSYQGQDGHFDYAHV